MFRDLPLDAYCRTDSIIKIFKHNKEAVARSVRNFSSELFENLAQKSLLFYQKISVIISKLSDKAC